MDISAVYDSIKNRDNDTILNVVIAKYLGAQGLTLTAQQWRLENYEILRGWAYPNPTELNDCMVKINSGNPELAAEGQQQLTDYCQTCLSVKERFPKL